LLLLTTSVSLHGRPLSNVAQARPAEKEPIGPIDQTDQAGKIAFFIQSPVIFCTQVMYLRMETTLLVLEEFLVSSCIPCRSDFQSRTTLPSPFHGTQFA